MNFNRPFFRSVFTYYYKRIWKITFCSLRVKFRILTKKTTHGYIYVVAWYNTVDLCINMSIIYFNSSFMPYGL